MALPELSQTPSENLHSQGSPRRRRTAEPRQSGPESVAPNHGRDHEQRSRERSWSTRYAIGCVCEDVADGVFV